MRVEIVITGRVLTVLATVNPSFFLAISRGLTAWATPFTIKSKDELILHQLCEPTHLPPQQASSPDLATGSKQSSSNQADNDPI